MKTIKLLAGVTALALTMPATAALPPEYQRAAELKAIINHDDLVRAFPQGEHVTRVEFVRPALYRVTAGACQLYARIVNKQLPAGMVGAVPFDVVLTKAECPAS